MHNRIERCIHILRVLYGATSPVISGGGGGGGDSGNLSNIELVRVFLENLDDHFVVGVIVVCDVYLDQVYVHLCNGAVIIIISASISSSPLSTL